MERAYHLVAVLARAASTIGLERATNPFLGCPDLTAFLALKRDWPTVKQRLGLK